MAVFMPLSTLKKAAFCTQCNYDYRMIAITSSDYFPQTQEECLRIIQTTSELHSDKKLILCDKPSFILKLRGFSQLHKFGKIMYSFIFN
jgi:hypothetical protein